jgi:hypothetical protein
MKRLMMLGVAMLLAACANGTPTGPGSFSAQSPSASALLVATGGPTSTYNFYDCVGPAGTPTSFTAEKTATPPASGAPVSSASAFRLTDGSGIFVVLSFGEGNFSPPGIEESGVATVTCKVNTSGGVLEFSGFLTSAP